MREILPAKVHDLRRQLRARHRARCRLDHGLDLLPHFRIGHAEDGDVAHRGVQRQHVLNFLGIDVHPARDDHEQLAIRQIEEAVSVQVTHVPQRAPAPLVEGLLGLLGIVVVLECIATSAEPHHSVLADRQFVAVVVTDVHHAPHGGPDRSRVGQPLLGPDPGHAAPLGSRVVLVNHGSPPLDHAAFHLGRARRGGVDHRAQAGEIVLRPLPVTQLEQADEHGRHELRVRDPVLFNQGQALSGIEAFHDHRRAPHALHRHRPQQRSGVIERSRTEVDVALGKTHQAAQHRGQHGIGTEGVTRQRATDPLGLAGGARGIEHGRPFPLDRKRHCGVSAHEFVEGGVPIDGGRTQSEAQIDAGRAGHQRLGQVGQRGRGDQHSGTAVSHDVGGLVRRQVGVDHGVVETGALQPPHHLMGPMVVGQEHRHVIALTQTPGVERLSQLARTSFQLGKGHRLPRRGNDGWTVGRRGGIRRR